MKKITKIFLLILFLFTLNVTLINADDITGDVTVTVDNGIDATLTITSEGNTSSGDVILSYNSPYTLSWTSTNAVSCTLNGNAASPTASGTSISYKAISDQAYTLICTNSSGTSITKKVKVIVPPAPTNLTSSCSADAKKVTLNWILPSGYDGGYVRNSVLGQLPFNIDVLTGKVATINITPGNLYKNIFIQTRASNNAWSTVSNLIDVICVPPEIVLTTKSVNTSHALQDNTVTVYGNINLINAFKIKEKGFVYNRQLLSDPDYNNFSTVIKVDPAASGDLSANISGLSPNVNYKVRAYAIGEDNTIYYGNTLSFTYKNYPNLTASDTTPTTAAVGIPVSLTSTITNIGSTYPSRSFYNFFQIANTADGGEPVTDIINNNTMSLGFYGSSQKTTFSYTFTNAGTYYVRACADKKNSSDTGLIDEGSIDNENDNCSPHWTPIKVNPTTIDLTASDTTPTTAVSGISVDLTSTITNIGNTSTSKSFNNFFQVKKRGLPFIDLPSTEMSKLSTGASATATTPYAFTDSGTYYVRACADKSDSNDSGLISESDETNNCSPDWTTVTVVPPDAPFGSLSTLIKPATCAIARGANTCTIPINYYVLNATTNSSITSDRPQDNTPVVSGIPASVPTPIVRGSMIMTIKPKTASYNAYFGTNNLYLYNDGNLLAGPLTINATCTGTDTSDSNGICIPSDVPVLETPTFPNITPTSVTMTVNIRSLGTPIPTVGGTTYGLITGKENNSTGGVFGTQPLTRPLIGLTPNTTYYGYGYLIANGITYYSPKGSFTTIKYGTTGNITSNLNPCNIDEGSTSCATDLSWNTIEPVGTSYVSKDGVTVKIANDFTSLSQDIPFGYILYSLFAGDNTPLDEETVSAQCSSGTQWNGSQCMMVCKTSDCLDSPPITCNSNQILDKNNVCFTCPTGQVAIRAINKCDVKKSCDIGETRVIFDNSCTTILPTSCTSPKKWDSCIGKCVKPGFSSVGLCGKSKNYSYTEN